MLGLTMQRVWLTLVAVDRALSCRVLACHLDPNVEAHEDLVLESQSLAKASKLIEPFILLYFEKPNRGPYDQQFLTKICHELKKTFIAVTKLPDAVVDKQLKERTELTHSRIGSAQRESILAAGLALQQAGVIDAKTDVKAAVDSLIDDQVPLPTN